MRVSQNSILAIAARHGRIAFVYLKDGEPRDWALSCKGAKSARNAASMVGSWIAKYDPDVVVIEDPCTATRKKRKVKSLLNASIRVADRVPAMVVKGRREQLFKNKYEEAVAWVDKYPQLAPKLPVKRRVWEPEPRNIVFFEALALVHQAGFISSP